MRLFGPPKTSKKYWLEWATERMKQGHSRQATCLQLLQAKVASVDEAQAKSEAERELFEVLVQRNLQGSALEKAGHVNEAVSLYEANVADEFIGQHPYERLRIIYSKRQDYTNAIRICQAYLSLSAREDSKKKETFRKHLEKLKQTKQTG